MNEPNQTLAEDLAYVRRAVAGSDRWRSPSSIYFVWALITLIGFSMVDFAPRSVPFYWLIAAPAGFLASMWLGWQGARRGGMSNRVLGGRIFKHWLGLLIGCSLTGLATWAGVLDWRGLGTMIVLISALAYYFAGIHGERSWLYISFVLAAAYVALLFISGPVWTIAGVVIAIALIAGGIAARSPAGAE